MIPCAGFVAAIGGDCSNNGYAAESCAKSCNLC